MRAEHGDGAVGLMKKGISHPADEGLGRSRGGLTTKFHLACDGRGRPLSIVGTPGQQHDSTQLQAVLEGICVPHPAGCGRPRTRLTVSSPTRATVTHAVAAGCGSDRSHTPFQSDATSVRNAPFGQDPGRYASTKPSMPAATWSSGASIASNRLKQWRGLATRYEKRAVNCRAVLVLASIVLWLEG